MEIDKLIELGFTRNQAKTYIALLQNPGVATGFLSKKLLIDRSFL